MFVIVVIMLCGVAAGFMLRNKNMKIVPRLVTLLVWALLFMLGAEIGADPHITSSIGGLGAEALLITCGGVAGSVLGAWALWHFADCRKKEDGNER